MKCMFLPSGWSDFLHLGSFFLTQRQGGALRIDLGVIEKLGNGQIFQCVYLLFIKHRDIEFGFLWQEKLFNF